MNDRSAIPGGTCAGAQPAVRTERRGDVLIIVMNRPHARNAVNSELAAGIAAALDELDAHSDLRVGILVGAGPGFCAGMDLKAYLDEGSGSPVIDGRGFAGICRRPPDTPLIAAVEGFAIAGGLEIALSCDLIVAARGVNLGIPEVKRGLIAGAGALIRLPRRLPHHVAMRMAITGDPITAERAHELGLVNELCEPGTALETALALANTLCENAPLAVQVSKKLITRAPLLDEDAAWKLQEPLVDMIVNNSRDAREGARAFAERRAPVWSGR
jgi:enoyl-CoA hydratase